MLKELLRILKAKPPLRDMLDEFTLMAEKAEWMFVNSIHVLLGEKPAEDMAKDIYAKDKEVNEHERSIRRKIVTHLSLNPQADVPVCLMLMSVVKDTERIGDYCKNFYELATMIKIAFDRGRYKTPIRDLVKQVEGLFADTRSAFAHSNEKAARSVITRGEQVNQQCNLLIKQLVADDLPTNKAVAYALAVRYIKRVSSHLNNIATSVVTSVDNLDFSVDSTS